MSRTACPRVEWDYEHEVSGMRDSWVPSVAIENVEF